MGLSSLFTHVLVLTGLNRPWGHCIQICLRVPSSCSGHRLLRSFNGLEPGGLESTIRKKRREKEADIPWFTQKANKAPAQGLLCSWRPQAPSRWDESTEHLLERVSKAQTGKWTQRTSALQRNSLRDRKRERERKKDRGTKALMQQRCFNQHNVGIYTVVILSKDKD